MLNILILNSYLIYVNNLSLLQQYAHFLLVKFVYLFKCCLKILSISFGATFVIYHIMPQIHVLKTVLLIQVNT